MRVNLKESDRLNNDCLTQCVAYYFDIHPARVPFFVRHKDWQGRLGRFFIRRGYKITCYGGKIKSLLTNKREIYFVQGVSPRSKASRKTMRRAIHHMALYRGTKPYFDPNYRTRPVKHIIWVWKVTKLVKSKGK